MTKARKAKGVFERGLSRGRGLLFDGERDCDNVDWACERRDEGKDRDGEVMDELIGLAKANVKACRIATSMVARKQSRKLTGSTEIRSPTWTVCHCCPYDQCVAGEEES